MTPPDSSPPPAKGAVPLTTVGALVIGPSDRGLLIKTHKWRGRWGVPGGKVNYGESLRQALLREFREETGLVLQGIWQGPVQESIRSPEFYKEAHMILFNFIAEAETELVELNDEAEAYTWTLPERALGYDLNRPTRRLLEFYLEHRRQLVPFE